VALLSAEQNLEKRSTKLSVAGYVAKPVDFDDLVSTVRELAGAPI
jgi:hypothetical protein